MKHTVIMLIAASTLISTACAREQNADNQASAMKPAASETVPATATSAASISPVAQPTLASILVHKNPSCGCCELWVEHLRKAGFEVAVRDEDDLNAVKERLGVPYGKGSCHTAEVGGYIVEGHVPVEDIKRLLTEKPDARGLVLPGMPLGSPGMEVPDGSVKPYTVELVKRDGNTVAFAEHGR
ncbi:DUF411 domain-containing protein [Lysobacter sp. Root494]|uniref:DUF411 domain-containing protein n=1 Tax=Lysobacter sp. Root494 TaxID=1736549 RepID=UPI000B291F67|nr:DUF411 domain-containing protein [Lysobacter sp. Root494]